MKAVYVSTRNNAHNRVKSNHIYFEIKSGPTADGIFLYLLENCLKFS
jgi:hypothetical protein